MFQRKAHMVTQDITDVDNLSIMDSEYVVLSAYHNEVHLEKLTFNAFPLDGAALLHAEYQP